MMRTATRPLLAAALLCGALVSSASAWEYKGCFYDSWDRAIGWDTWGDGNLASCFAFAEAHDQNTVGLQEGSQCWACNDCAYSRHGAAYDCPEGQEGGGSWQNQVRGGDAAR